MKRPANVFGYIEEMTRNGSPDQEIADALRWPVELLQTRYKLQLPQWRAERRMTLRHAQTEAVKKGSIPMLIFLSKHELGHDTQDDDRAADSGSGPEPFLDEKMG